MNNKYISLISQVINVFKIIFSNSYYRKLFLISTALIILCFFLKNFSKWKIKRQIKGLSNNAIEMSPEQFMRMRNKSMGGKGCPSYANTMNYAGIYILYNHSKNMYYIGQAKKILDRINQHFTGHGNGDVYADWKYGDKFTIRTIALKGSGFKTLNELERNTISVYNSYAKGYNKTRGNRG